MNKKKIRFKKRFKVKKRKGGAECPSCRSHLIRFRTNYPFGRKSKGVLTMQCKNCNKLFGKNK